MAVNFAPYQDEPETSRALSPPPPLTSPQPRLITSPRTSLDRNTRTLTSPRTYTYDQNDSDYFQPHPIPSPPPQQQTLTPPPSTSRWTAPRADVDMFTTSLGWRLDYEAALAYLLLPPAGGVLLLVLEHQSDYVRFHAWQSSLLFAFVFVVHIILSFSAWASWAMVCMDVVGICWLSWRAWVDAATLDRYEVPFFGSLASSILDDE